MSCKLLLELVKHACEIATWRIPWRDQFAGHKEAQKHEYKVNGKVSIDSALGFKVL
jgi:hypothetical protein